MQSFPAIKTILLAFPSGESVGVADDRGYKKTKIYLDL